MKNTPNPFLVGSNRHVVSVCGCATYPNIGKSLIIGLNDDSCPAKLFRPKDLFLLSELCIFPNISYSILSYHPHTVQLPLCFQITDQYGLLDHLYANFKKGNIAGMTKEIARGWYCLLYDSPL